MATRAHILSELTHQPAKAYIFLHFSGKHEASAQCKSHNGKVTNWTGQFIKFNNAMRHFEGLVEPVLETGAFHLPTNWSGW